jgi:hypothetical protein
MEWVPRKDSVKPPGELQGGWLKLIEQKNEDSGADENADKQSRQAEELKRSNEEEDADYDEE